MGLIDKVLAQAHWQVTRRTRAHLPVILMYHRVAELSCDSWQLAVSPANFEQHIARLVQQREVVPLSEILTARGDRPLAAVTFDDGYRDVLTNALPVLEKHRCPATLFLATDWVGSAREFWWDELTRITLEADIAAPLECRVPGMDRDLRLIPSGSRRSRLRAMRELWSALLPLEHHARQQWLEDLAARAGVPLSMRESHRIVDAQDVASLKGSVLAIGAHTGTHLSLPLFDEAVQAAEITRSRDACTALTGITPSCFAYPFGHRDERAARQVRAAGFTLAVTTHRAMVRTGRDPTRLPRLAIGNWGGGRFARNLP